MYDVHRFHAVFQVLAAGPGGLRYGELARTFRNQAVRLPALRLRALLADLVNREALTVRADGRTVRYGPGARAGVWLGQVSPTAPGGLRYRADQVLRVVQAIQEEPAVSRGGSIGQTGGSDPDGVPADADLIPVVRALAQETATGLVSLAELRKRTGLDRVRLHAAVRRHVAAGELMLHPLAARHQEARAEMAEGIRTPAGQNLFYVELA